MKIGQFTIQNTQGQARAGELMTAHGIVKTPAFVPCATHGSLRSVPLDQLENQLILANIYHLYLRSGIETIESLGGLHKFMGWDRAIITDSGGFQAFALPKFVKIDNDGIAFKSHIDGTNHRFTPEQVVKMQERIGVDIATCLDVCTGFPESERKVAQAVSLTGEWAMRSVDAWADKKVLLYGMVQGSIYKDQRERAVKSLIALPFSGFAIGGNMYTFGKQIAELNAEKPKMWEIVAFTTSLLPAEKPRHLLGVGEPSDLIEGVRNGTDTFDCVMATRLARHGSAWIRDVDDKNYALSPQLRELVTLKTPGVFPKVHNFNKYKRVDISAEKYARDTRPLDSICTCLICTSSYQRGYLRHLCKIKDPLVGTLLSIHNVHILQTLMTDMREAILTGRFEEDFPPLAIS